MLLRRDLGSGAAAGAEAQKCSASWTRLTSACRLVQQCILSRLRVAQLSRAAVQLAKN